MKKWFLDVIVQEPLFLGTLKFSGNSQSFGKADK